MSSIAMSPVRPITRPAEEEADFPAAQIWPIRWSFYAGLIALAVGGLVGLLQAVERIDIDLYGAFGLQNYYQGLTLHGVLLALVFTFTFSNGFLSLTTMRGFERPLASTLLVQGMFVVGALGVLMAGFAMLTNQASVLYTFYAPLQAHTLFYLGAALLVVSTWLVSLNQLLTLRAWRREHPGERIPLLAFASIATYLMWDLASVGIAVEVLGFLTPWSLGLLDGVDPQLNRTLFWFSGHAIVYFWLLPAYVSWYLMVPKQVGGRIYSDALTRLVFILFLLYSVPTGLHHQYTDPGVPVWLKTVHLFTTMLVFFPSVVTAFSIMSALEAAGRAKGGRGLLGWIPKLPWGNPSVTAQLLAMFVFLFGGITGLINASYTVNQVVHNTAFIPGHFHMTVGTAVALTIMGVAYWLVPYLTGHALFAPRLALLQSWLYAIGVLVFARGQIAGGLAGQPRRTAIGQAAYELPEWALDNWLTAMGGVLMTISGALFFIVIIGTIVRNVPARVEIPVAESVISSKETWGILDRFGFWTVLAVGLIVIAYAPTFRSLLPANLCSPGWNTIWGPPVAVPHGPLILAILAVLVVVGIFVWFWRLLQSYVD